MDKKLIPPLDISVCVVESSHAALARDLSLREEKNRLAYEQRPMRGNNLLYAECGIERCAMDDYTKSYQQLVADIADALRPMDVEKLDWFYKESLSNRRPPAQADAPWTPLSVLRGLEEAGVFSSERPEGLAAAMLEVKREDQEKAVKGFVEKHQGTLSSLRKRRRPVPRDEKDGPYPPRHRAKAKGLLAVVPDNTNSKEADVEDGDYVTWIPPPQIPKQGAGVASSAPQSVPAKTEGSCLDDDSYSYPYDWNCLITDSHPIVSPESSLSSTSSDGKSGSGPGSSDDDDYCYPYQSNRESWLTTASGRVTLTQKMKLTTPPLQRQIRSLENHTIASSPIKWNLKSSELVFKLHIDPLGHHSGLSATLYLQKQPKSIASSEIVTAELTLHQKSSPSVTLHQKSSPSKPKAPSQLKLFQCLLVMDMPDEHTSASSHWPWQGFL
ncbi:hypothetical protein GBAR_LOCUS4992 [Geodia barretti]|uniref:DED domain-containing protein n=1 Tax=Geodia barretti TaxID=519541 RepID=A0AA35RAT1_GEOBA|nr:hypothetical protein GBAR_LOCUS4992 [Geodia barretti]